MSLDRNGRILQCNLTCADLLGVPRSKFIDNNIQQYFSQEQNLLTNRLRQARENLEPVKLELSLPEHPARKMTDALLEVRWEEPRDDLPGQFLVAVVDISETKRLERELLNALLAAETASKSKREFMANLSHESRTPMNGILGMLQLLEMGGVEDSKREYLRMARSSAHTLLTIINDILDLSKIEAGRMEIRLQPFALRTLVGDIARMFEVQAQGKGVRLVWHVQDDLPETFIGDEARIRQILFNLVGNSVKFTEVGTVAIHVEDTKLRTNGHSRISFKVEDTGVGIPQSQLKNVFKPFVQAESGMFQKSAGTGLGLTIVKRLVDLMKGTVSLQSAEGQGATVEFTLPLKAQNAGKGKAEAEDRKEPLTGGRSGKRPVKESGIRVLLVEDNPISLLMTREFLKEHGHEATVAENGQEALDLLDKGEFDVVLMDMRLPILDGAEAARRIRSGETASPRDIPIIALTAYTGNDEQKIIQETGVDALFNKPIPFEDLDARIRELAQKASRD